MNVFRTLILTCLLIANSSHAAGEPLTVGIESFEPPFIMQGANQEVYGYDIDMMNYLCKTLDRTCEFKIMKFANLLPAVMNKEIDVAVSSITITPERSELIDFSIPYLLGHSRFLALNTPEMTAPFSLQLLAGKKIGVDEGTIFADEINKMGVKDAKITEFDTIELALEGLRDGKVDMLLMDAPAALYWEANSSGAFKAIGEAFEFGFGIGVVINKDSKPLLNAINQALQQYQNSNAYKLNYERYIAHF